VSGTLSELMDAIKAKFGTADSMERGSEETTASIEHISSRHKRPKSDIGELLHQAHTEGHFPEQHG
jgi:hypothetical protein